MAPRKKTTSGPSEKKRVPQRPQATNPAEKPNTSPSAGVDSPRAAAALGAERHTQQPTHLGGASAERQRRIAETAYTLYLQRGGEHGHAMEDWLRAERQVTEEENRRKQR